MKVIIFDFDGVIIDSCEHVYELTKRNFPGMSYEGHKQLFSGNIHREVEKRSPVVYDEVENDRWLKEEYYPKKLTLPIFEGIGEVIQTLAKKHTLVINSSGREPGIRDFLEKHNLSQFFQEIYGKEVSKDKTEKFRMILDKYQIGPEETLLITDTLGDVLEARVCGIKSLAVTYGYHNREHYEPMASEVIGFADTPADILKLIP